MDILSLFCFCGVLPFFILVFFGIVIGILYYDRRKHAEAWRKAAQRAGLAFHPPGWILGRPTLDGDWHGRAVRIYTITRGGGGRTGSSSTYMRIEMAARPPGNASLSISERNFFSQLGRAGAEIPLGDAEFDARFVTRGHPTAFVRGVLSARELRRLLLQARYVNIEMMGEAMLRYQQLNVETDAETLLFLLALLFDLAEAVEREAQDFPHEVGG
ncbi:MAG: hypothetical protein ACOY0R_02925 [Chloroflexota bacterium]